MRKLVLFSIISLTSLSAYGSNHYVNTAASGSGSGADWPNACTEFTGSCAISSLVRGDTYFVATGSYASRVWNKAASGSLVITIQRATVSAHGTDTGWSDAFDGQVTWGDGSDVTTAFWTFNGVTFPASASPLDGGDTVANYGFLYNHTASCGSNDQGAIGTVSAANVTYIGVAATMCAPSFDAQKWCWLGSPGSDNLLISHAYCVNSIDIIQMQGSDSVESNSVFEFIYSANNGGSGTNHGEAYQLVCNSCTIRYNYVADSGLSGGVTAVISGNAAGSTCGSNIPMCNTAIYGNVFKDVESGSGIIHAAGSTGISGTHFYNNTIIHLTTGNYFDECTGHSCPAGSGNNIVENNLIWNSVCGIGQFGLSGDVADYNTQLSCLSGTADVETHGQTGSFNPFVNSASLNYNLASNPGSNCASGVVTCGGLVLASPYTTDFSGNARDSTGQWARGAFDIAAADPQITPVNQGARLSDILGKGFGP